jgi:ABC-type multidrug transport system ATPase subunit
MKPLADLSVGQKAAALLIVGLSDGRFPIVIDQPEDSLDLRSIWADVCCTLRDSKERRQFIFTTHNSSVAVASDSDKFTILEAKATHAEVLYSGSINSSKIRSEVIAYLEGGPDTYKKKREKYNL